MKKITAICIISLTIFLSFSKALSSQTICNKEFKINVGALLNFSPEGDIDVLYAGYLAPSFRKNQHEFYIGTQMTDQNRGGKFKSLFGGIMGYKYYIFKEPMRMNMFLHYSLQYFHRSYERQWHIWNNGNPYNITEKWNSDLINNLLGIGFNVFFDKNFRYGFNSTLSYSPTMFFINTNNYEQRDIYWRNIEITIGFSARIFSLKDKIDKK